jgi:hypothetical protein
MIPLDQSVFDPPLEEWLIGICHRCAAKRQLHFPHSLHNTLADSALETVLDMFEANLPDLLVAIPSAARDTDNLTVRIRISWPHYRRIARAAHDRLVRVFHSHSSDSLGEVLAVKQPAANSQTMHG